MSENANAAKWYVVHTYSGYENKVKTNLEKIIENRGISHLITDVRIPVELTSETNAEGVTKESESKIFPSYVFVKMVMTDETWHIVMTITGATGFVGTISEISPDLKKVTVTASVFGRQTPVELDVSSIAAEK